MAINILTRDDLAHFKTELLQDVQQLLRPNAAATTKKWLKTYEVRNMLGISNGTLQNLRINGTIAFTKIGGLLFYDYDDIVRLMEARKKNPIPSPAPQHQPR